MLKRRHDATVSRSGGSVTTAPNKRSHDLRCELLRCKLCQTTQNALEKTCGCFFCGLRTGNKACECITKRLFQRIGDGFAFETCLVKQLSQLCQILLLLFGIVVAAWHDLLTCDRSRSAHSRFRGW